MCIFRRALKGKKKMDKNELEIDGTIYGTERAAIGDMLYVIARASAGVFAGYLKSRNGKEVILNDVIRIYHWEGAATLSQLATEGTKNPEGCKFTCKVDEELLTETIEILSCTEIAKESIEGVSTWKV